MINKISNLWKILNKKNKSSIFGILLLFFISSLIDLIGVSSIIPFLSVLSDPNIINENIYLIKINRFFNFSQSEYIIFLGIFSFLVLSLNQFMRIFTNWYNLSFAEKFLYKMTKKMYEYYLRKPYAFFLNVHSSNLLQKITIQVNAAVAGFMTPILSLINQIFVIIIIVLFLLYLEPFITLFLISTLSIFYFFIIKKLNYRITELGSITPKHFAKASRVIGDSFGSIKELKIRKNYQYFIDDFKPLAKKFAEANIKINLFQQLPGGFVELFAFAILLSISTFMFNFYDQFQDIVPLLGILVLSLRRILPAVQSSYTQFTQIKYYQPAFDEIFPDIQDEYNFSKDYKKNGYMQNKIDFFNKIEFKNVTYKYHNSTFDSLSEVNISINKNEFLGIAGDSGSGKTTFLDNLVYLLKPTSGKILIDNNELNETNSYQWNLKIGYAPQNGFLLDKDISENIAFGSIKKEINMERIINVCNIAQISEFIENNLENQYQTKIGENGIKLSGGQQQRIIIARALYNDPDLIVLDEATNAIDSINENKILNNIRARFKNKTIIFVTHRLDSLKICDRILFFNNNKISDTGKYEELINKNEKFYNLSIKIDENKKN